MCLQSPLALANDRGKFQVQSRQAPNSMLIKILEQENS